MAKTPRFGDLAVEMGYCTRESVERAAEIQQDLVDRGYPRLLIGLVMARYGMIENNQLIQVLKRMDQLAGVPAGVE